MPAPSPSTKPSRLRSNGRDARGGSSLAVDVAPMLQKPGHAERIDHRVGAAGEHPAPAAATRSSGRRRRSRRCPRRRPRRASAAARCRPKPLRQIETHRSDGVCRKAAARARRPAAVDRARRRREVVHREELEPEPEAQPALTAGRVPAAPRRRCACACGRDGERSPCDRARCRRPTSPRRRCASAATRGRRS